MQSVAVVTGADRGLGLAIVHQLLVQGWRVYAGQFMTEWTELSQLAARYADQLVVVPLDVADSHSVAAAAKQVAETAEQVDVLINNAGVTSPTMRQSIREGLDYGEIQRIYNTNSMGPLRVVEAFLPLVSKSEMKRLCFVSSEAGSVARSQRTSWFGYCMSKAALNMAVKNLFNDLRPKGYTFRIFHPGWVRSYMSGHKNEQADLEPETAAQAALTYFLGSGTIAMEHPVVCNEDELVLRDWQGNDWPW